MKYKLIAAAILAAGVSNVANATITQTNTDVNNTGGSELVLSLFDGTNSFTVDLGIAMGSSIPPSVTLTNLSSNTGAASFFTGGVLNSNVQWAVTAADSTLAGTGNDLTTFGQRMLTTVNGPVPATYTNGDVQQSASILSGYITNLNNVAGHNNASYPIPTEFNGSALSTSPADPSSWANGMEALWAQGGKFDANSGAGTMAFMQLSQTIVPGARSGGVANAGDIATQSLLGSFTLAANGQLSFAPVPVPAAVWLFGSALMGMVGVARRRKVTV